MSSGVMNTPSMDGQGDPLGIFVQKEAPEYCQEYDKIIEQAMKG